MRCGSSETFLLTVYTDVGMTWEEAHGRCPDGVVPACHNSRDSVTVSGSVAAVAKFVAQLRNEGTFVREVNSSGQAFHSPAMQRAVPTLKQHLSEV